MDKVTWFEIPADDTKRAGAFYGNVFGWSTSDMGGGSLMTLTTPSDDQGNPTEPGAINGDISPRTADFDKPTIVVTVQDIDAKLEMVERAGGKIVRPREDHAEMGIAWALVSDTEGNKLGIIQDI